MENGQWEEGRYPISQYHNMEVSPHMIRLEKRISLKLILKLGESRAIYLALGNLGILLTDGLPLSIRRLGRYLALRSYLST